MVISVHIHVNVKVNMTSVLTFLIHVPSLIVKDSRRSNGMFILSDTFEQKCYI